LLVLQIFYVTAFSLCFYVKSCVPFKLLNEFMQECLEYYKKEFLPKKILLTKYEFLSVKYIITHSLLYNSKLLQERIYNILNMTLKKSKFQMIHMSWFKSRGPKMVTEFFLRIKNWWNFLEQWKAKFENFIRTKTYITLNFICITCNLCWIGQTVSLGLLFV